MPQVNVDLVAARGVLTAAIAAAKVAGYRPTHAKSEAISEVMQGKHLTYRYVLLTNLLAKATNAGVNALAMQAKADLDGAFDSRSLCHGVVVPSDRMPNGLAGKLGRSNEPYLNKPARYPALTTENAVRRGYDRTILEKSIDILGGLRDRADANAALVDAIHHVLKRESEVVEVAELEGDATLHKVLSQFAVELIATSGEGETSAILSGLAFYILGRGQGRKFEIKVHPVNQAGSSSREVLDIDVYMSKELNYAAEVKDKLFAFEDVEHACTKAKAAGLDSFFFLCGPQSGGVGRGAGLVERIAQKGVRVTFVDVLQFFYNALGFAPDDLSAEEVWDFIEASVKSARVKDDTRAHVLMCAARCGLISGD